MKMSQVESVEKNIDKIGTDFAGKRYEFNTRQCIRRPLIYAK